VTVARLVRDDGAVVCERCVVAKSALRRMRGLLGRDDLPADEAIYLRPASSVHTAFMRFPIDVVFVDRELRVLKVVPALAAWRTAACRGAKGAFELRAGTAAARGVAPGTKLSLV
jgi:uncharacterized membrane protein (UPF0127 family)